MNDNPLLKLEAFGQSIWMDFIQRPLDGRPEGETGFGGAIVRGCGNSQSGWATAGLGCLDALILTAGIGEHIPSIRWRICEGMEFLGIRLDSLCNEHDAAIISRDDSPVTVRVMKTDEELMIATHTDHLIQSKRA